METLLRVGAFDDLGRFRTDLFWEIQWLTRPPERARPRPNGAGAYGCRDQGSLFTRQPDHPSPPIALTQPSPRDRLDAEHEALDFTVSGHPLDRYPDIAWETYCPVAELARHIGEEVTCCGLIVIDRVVVHDNGDSMKFMSIADRTGMIETEMFADTYRRFGLATVRYPVLEVTATVETFDNHRGYTLNVHRAGKPRKRKTGATPDGKRTPAPAQ
jgi:DNA polymerase-3 subunit alpha